MEIEITESKKTVTKLTVNPCGKCGCDDISIWDCGYTTFNVCGATCKKCKREVKINGDVSKRSIVEKWNSCNGDLTDEEKIAVLQAQIRDMNKEPLV